ncbi:hypothetical protein H920_01091 [Fukomys damarensis]|uniref:Uncharacterized protein n=1 Tax=Fukomys damarensis TaxID=885580 RepID=A0A091E2A7_FUKDA|nr:hypothetical protein H920_01091 [Fukomys damarensis]
MDEVLMSSVLDEQGSLPGPRLRREPWALSLCLTDRHPYPGGPALNLLSILTLLQSASAAEQQGFTSEQLTLGLWCGSRERVGVLCPVGVEQHPGLHPQDATATSASDSQNTPDTAKCLWRAESPRFNGATGSAEPSPTLEMVLLLHAPLTSAQGEKRKPPLPPRSASHLRRVQVLLHRSLEGLQGAGKRRAAASQQGGATCDKLVRLPERLQIGWRTDTTDSALAPESEGAMETPTSPAQPATQLCLSPDSWVLCAEQEEDRGIQLSSAPPLGTQLAAAPQAWSPPRKVRAEALRKDLGLSSNLSASMLSADVDGTGTRSLLGAPSPEIVAGFRYKLCHARRRGTRSRKSRARLQPGLRSVWPRAARCTVSVREPHVAAQALRLRAQVLPHCRAEGRDGDTMLPSEYASMPAEPCRGSTTECYTHTRTHRSHRHLGSRGLLASSSFHTHKLPVRTSCTSPPSASAPGQDYAGHHTGTAD